MRLISQGGIATMFGLVLLGMVGCGESNESEVTRQQKETKGIAVEAKEQPKNLEELSKLQPKSASASYKASRYPGAK